VSGPREPLVLRRLWAAVRQRRRGAPERLRGLIGGALCLLLRRPARGRQNDEARIVSATMDETGRFGVPDRLFEVRIRKADVTADAFTRRQECGLLALMRWSWAMNAAARSRRSWIMLAILAWHSACRQRARPPHSNCITNCITISDWL
jgi:hypothetical protein